MTTPRPASALVIVLGMLSACSGEGPMPGGGYWAPVADVLGIPVDATGTIDIGRLDVVEPLDATVDARDATVDVRDGAVDVRDATVDVRDATVDVRDGAVDVRDAPDVPVTFPDGGVTDDPVTYSGSFPPRSDGVPFRVTLRVLGQSRDVWLLVPTNLSPGAPLMLAFHGTNADGSVVLSESGAAAVCERAGVVFAAPSSRWFGERGADFDHPGGNGTYWETANNPNPDTNEDLLLVRAIIQEARRAYRVDATRVYAMGHSNGGFMAYMVSQVLAQRVVGFGENAAGLSRCDPQQSCRFRGRGTTCAELAAQPGWCACAGPSLPAPLRATGRATPAVLFHGTDDAQVSVYHSCALEAALRARGGPVQLTLFDGGGHGAFSTFATRVFDALAPHRLTP